MHVTERMLRHARDGGWIAVDFDGTLAYYDKWTSLLGLGLPIKPMVDRVRAWCEAGITVRIFTARMILPGEDVWCAIEGRRVTAAEINDAIGDWTETYVGHRLEATCIKDLHMIELWDDRAIQIVANTGRTLAEEHQSEIHALRGAP